MTGGNNLGKKKDIVLTRYKSFHTNANLSNNDLCECVIENFADGEAVAGAEGSNGGDSELSLRSRNGSAPTARWW